MPKDVGHSPKPLRTWRPMVLWTAGILLILGSACLLGNTIVTVWQTNRVVEQPRPHSRLPMCYSAMRTCELEPYAQAIEELGGQEEASRRLSIYLRMPQRLAPNKLEALILLGVCGRDGVLSLRSATRADSASLRKAAIRVLSNIGVEAQPAVPDIEHALRDEDEGVRAAAAEALKRIQGEEAGK